MNNWLLNCSINRLQKGGIIIFLLLYFMITLPNSLAQQLPCFSIQTDRSKIEFQVTHMGVLEIIGSFGAFTGKLCFSNEKQKKILTSGNLIIQVASLQTDNETRNQSLLSESFLDANSYPIIEVELIKLVDSIATLEIFIKNKRSVHAVPVEYEIVKNKKSEFIISGNVKLSRKKMGLIFNSSLDSFIGDEIKISFSLSVD